VIQPRWRRLVGAHVEPVPSVRSGDSVGIYFVAVKRGFRHRGFGAAVVQYAIQAGFQTGAKLAVLQATTSGFPLYVNMGFTHVADYHMWDLPVSAQN
jgi:GNAT superfamily N-acetyltransferase